MSEKPIVFNQRNHGKQQGNENFTSTGKFHDEIITTNCIFLIRLIFLASKKLKLVFGLARSNGLTLG